MRHKKDNREILLRSAPTNAWNLIHALLKSKDIYANAQIVSAALEMKCMKHM